MYVFCYLQFVVIQGSGWYCFVLCNRRSALSLGNLTCARPTLGPIKVGRLYLAIKGKVTRETEKVDGFVCYALRPFRLIVRRFALRYYDPRYKEELSKIRKAIMDEFTSEKLKEEVKACRIVPEVVERVQKNGAKNSEEFKKAVTHRKLFNSNVFPHGIRSEKEARQLVTRLLPGERKFIFDSLRKLTIDQYMEHKRLGNADVHPHDMVIIWYVYFIPAFVYGMVDNAVLITIGEQIDENFGAVLGISIMAAAAVSNMFVNLLGIGIPKYMEKILHFFGVKRPVLSVEQWNNPRVTFITTIARIVGIILGCTAGLFPLLFFTDMPTRGDLSSQLPDRGYVDPIQPADSSSDYSKDELTKYIKKDSTSPESIFEKKVKAMIADGETTQSTQSAHLNMV